MPYERAIELKEFPEKFKQEIWFGNLEGSLVKKEDNTPPPKNPTIKMMIPTEHPVIIAV